MGQLVGAVELVRGEQHGRAGHHRPPDGGVEQVQMVIPFGTLEPLVHKLRAMAPSEQKREAAASAGPPRWNPMLDDVKIRLTGEWSQLEMTAQEYSLLKVGDVIPMNPRISNEVRLCVEQKAKFVGEAGNCGKSWAVKISSPAG